MIGNQKRPTVNKDETHLRRHRLDAFHTQTLCRDLEPYGPVVHDGGRLSA